MHDAIVLPDGSRIRWTELPGSSPARVYIHGLGAMSAPYYLGIATHPALAGRRSLMIDMLGFGLSDRPEDFGYTLEDHADVLATALTAAGVRRAEVIAHSMGGAVAVVLAVRHPELVAALVLLDANLDPVEPHPHRPGSSGLSAYTEAEFLEYGRHEVRDRVGPHWWSTMRLAGRVALHRSAVHLARGTVPTVREHLLRLAIPRAFLHPERDGDVRDGEALTAGGVRLVPIPDAGHNLMLDNPHRTARAIAAFLDGPR
ncbi:alpha/beta hydrolase [Planomonospora alba]